MVIVLLAAALVAVKTSAVAKPPPAPVTVEVRATDDIFAAGLADGRLKRDLGTPPQAIPVTPGETLEVSATGKIACCGVAQRRVDAAGYPRNPLSDQGVHIGNPLHTRVSGFSDPTAAFMLLGVFDGDQIGDIDPIEIGRDKVVTVPSYANELYLGFADARGFNGPAGNDGDNKGSLAVTVTRIR